MITTSEAASARPSCGWRVHELARDARGSGAAAGSPSKRRSAAAIAASRPAGRGGGGSGNSGELPGGIGKPHSGNRAPVEPVDWGRRQRSGPWRVSYRSSAARLRALFAARTSWTNSER